MIYQKKLNYYQQKGLTNDLINRYSILNSEKYFIEDGSQNFLIFQPIFNTLTKLTGLSEK